MTFHYDIVENNDGGLALFTFKQDEAPENPGCFYNSHNKTLTFVRRPEQVEQIELVKDEAIAAFENDGLTEIAVIEVDEDDPDGTLNYTLHVSRTN